jgi:pimeloyl-ACP methyl ester carboxylesterase
MISSRSCGQFMRGLNPIGTLPARACPAAVPVYIAMLRLTGRMRIFWLPSIAKQEKDMTRRLGALLLALVLPFGFATPARAAVSARTISIGSATFEYCGNHSVNTPSTAIQTVVVVVHGTGRNACDYASFVETSASRAGRSASTLIVAPHFYASSDPRPSTRLLFWSSGGWKDGAASLNGGGISSFAVVDNVLRRVNDRTRFPSVTRIVVAGHSAGGWFTNRYAAGSQSGVATRYVVANPSSYLYYDNRRWRSGTLRPLTPAEISACPGYNRYRYGLERLNPYLAAAGDLAARYRTSEVTYLLGDRDTNPADPSLDRSCEANWQGAHRFQRGTQYHTYLGAVFGDGVYATHTRSVVPGVAHDGNSMFTGAQGQRALFG